LLRRRITCLAITEQFFCLVTKLPEMGTLRKPGRRHPQLLSRAPRSQQQGQTTTHGKSHEHSLRCFELEISTPRVHIRASASIRWISSPPGRSLYSLENVAADNSAKLDDHQTKEHL